MNFEELGVKKEIVRALREMDIVEPTTIQQKTIPLIMSGKDVIGISKTGSGKTVAFGVPLLEQVEMGRGLQMLVMAPTRELVCQIADELSKFSKYTPFNITTVFGGVAFGPQIDGMAVADIVVGTPGRLLDHLQRGNLDLSKLRFAVLDEADKMVTMGFIEDVDKILSQASKDLRMQLFGATISDEIKMIKRKYMRDPVVAEADKYVKNEYLKQYYYNIEAHEKFSLLVHLLKKEKAGRAMIFCAKRSTVEVVTKNLRAQGIDAEMIHGKLSQNKRLEIINNFRNGKPTVLMASAVAARGLDIKDVTHILNYDLSQDPQEYIHRVGRTARAGEAGKAITLLGPMDHDAFRNVLYYYDVKVDLLPKENFPMLRFDARSRQPRRGFGFGFGRGRDARPRHSDRAPRQGAYGSHPGGRRDARPRSHPGRSPRNRNHSGQQFSRPRSHGFHGERVSA